MDNAIYVMFLCVVMIVVVAILLLIVNHCLLLLIHYFFITLSIIIDDFIIILIYYLTSSTTTAAAMREDKNDEEEEDIFFLNHSFTQHSTNNTALGPVRILCSLFLYFLSLSLLSSLWTSGMASFIESVASKARGAGGVPIVDGVPGRPNSGWCFGDRAVWRQRPSFWSYLR